VNFWATILLASNGGILPWLFDRERSLSRSYFPKVFSASPNYCADKIGPSLSLICMVTVHSQRSQRFLGIF